MISKTPARTMGQEQTTGQKQFASIHDLPGPSGRIRPTLQLMRRPYEIYEIWRQKYGQTYLVRALNGDVVVTSNPENIRRILAARHDEISQFAIGTVGPLVGENSVILVNGQRHKRARSMLLPAFHGESLRTNSETMRVIAHQVAESWQAGQEIRVMDASLDYSLRVIIQVIFGVQEPERIILFQNAIHKYVSSFLPIFAFTRFFQKRWVPQWNRFLRNKMDFDKLLDEQIASGRGNPDTGTVLSRLLKARDEDGEPLSEQELKEQLITLLFAGHETTQIAIAWVMSWLHRKPDVLARLREEIDAANELDTILDSELLHGICQESLRLNPIVADFLRVSEVPLDLEEIHLPAGSTAAVLSCVVHMNPQIYPQPEEFNPDRWRDSNYKPYEFLAFGGGVRRCLGATMALMEMKIAIVTWLHLFEFRLPDNLPETEPVKRRNLTMAPASGIRLVVDRRIG